MGLDQAKAITGLRDLTIRFRERVRTSAPFYPMITTHVPSKGANERIAMLGAMPQMREWKGNRDFQTLRASDQILENQEWENSLLIETSVIEDDRLGMYGPTMDELGDAAAAHPDELVMEVVESNTALGFDNQVLYADAHVWGDSGAQDNNLGYNVADTAEVTDVEFKQMFRQATSQMKGYKDDRGRKLVRPTAKPSKWIVMVPLEMENQAHDALGKVIMQGDSNVQVEKHVEIFTNTNLVSPTQWYLFRVDSAMRGLIFQARTPLQHQVKGLDDIEDKGVKFMTRARYTVGPGAWWNTVRTTVS